MARMDKRAPVNVIPDILTQRNAVHATYDDTYDDNDYYNEDELNTRLAYSNIIAALHRNFKFILAFAILGALFGYFFTIMRDPVYIASSVIVLQPKSATLGTLEIAERFATDRSTVETQLDVLKSTALLGDVIDRISEKHTLAGNDPMDPSQSLPDLPREEQIKWLYTAMTTERNGESLALTISVGVSGPILAADIANEIVQTYIDNRLQQKQKQIQLATNILK